MLKLSNRGLYGIKALFELARNYGGTPMSIKEISTRHRMPVPFLEQVLHQLKKYGLVISHRGASGGYALSKDPSEITIGDAVRVLEGPFALCDCLQKNNGKEKPISCVTYNLYKKLGTIVEEAFNSVTLSELIKDNSDIAENISCKLK